jgi:replicative DNA helicase
MTIKERLADLIKKIHQGNDGDPIRTGFEGLDGIVSGFKKGCLYMLYAYKARGATTLMIHWSANILNQKNQTTSITLFTMDADAMNITERLVAHQSRIPLDKIRQVSLAEYERNVLVEESVEKLRYQPLLIDDSCSDMDSIEAKIRVLYHTGNADIVFVDSPRLILNTFGFSEGDHLQNCLARLKQLSNHLQVPIVIVCELAGESDFERPDLTKVQCTVNEKHSDIVMCLWRPEYFVDQRGDTVLLVLKNNFGPVGSIKLISHFEVQSLEEKI